MREIAAPAVEARRRTDWGRRIRRLPWPSLLVICSIVVVALFAPFLTPHDPLEQSLPRRLTPPAWEEGGTSEYLLGTDALGRDMFSRLLYGARVSLIVAVAALAAGGGVGLILGIVSGYFGGKWDALIMRAVDATLSFPTILLALLLAVTMGPGLGTVVIAVAMILWARFARVARGEVLSLKNQDFVTSAVVIGCRPVRIMIVHLLPMVLNSFMVLLTLHLGYVIIVESTLSFLGAGIPPPTPSWGQMVAEGRGRIATAWWLSMVPGLAITLLVLAFNLFGDWLRDHTDPRLRSLM